MQGGGAGRAILTLNSAEYITMYPRIGDCSYFLVGKYPVILYLYLIKPLTTILKCFVIKIYGLYILSIRQF